MGSRIWLPSFHGLSTKYQVPPVRGVSRTEQIPLLENGVSLPGLTLVQVRWPFPGLTCIHSNSGGSAPREGAGGAVSSSRCTVSLESSLVHAGVGPRNLSPGSVYTPRGPACPQAPPLLSSLLRVKSPGIHKTLSESPGWGLFVIVLSGKSCVLIVKKYVPVRKKIGEAKRRKWQTSLFSSPRENCC